MPTPAINAPLSAEAAERLLNSSDPDRIAEWNQKHSLCLHPPSWRTTGAIEPGRGLTIQSQEGSTNLHDVRLCDLDFGPVFSLANCFALKAALDHVVAKKVIIESCTFKHCVFRNLSWNAATIVDCTFESCIFLNCAFAHASLIRSRFSGLVNTDLRLSCEMKKCDFSYTDLQGTEFTGIAVTECAFDYSITDSRTLLSLDHLDGTTSFVGMSFSSARIAPSTRSRISLAIQRSFWQSVFDDPHRRVRSCLWRAFWFLFGYGFDLRRLVVSAMTTLGLLSILVHIASQHCAFQHIVDGKMTCLTLPQSFHFVILTMIAPDFSDITASPGSLPGTLLVLLISATGYLFLAALVARLTTIANWPE